MVSKRYVAEQGDTGKVTEFVNYMQTIFWKENITEDRKLYFYAINNTGVFVDQQEEGALIYLVGDSVRISGTKSKLERETGYNLIEIID